MLADQELRPLLEKEYQEEVDKMIEMELDNMRINATGKAKKAKKGKKKKGKKGKKKKKKGIKSPGAKYVKDMDEY